MSMGKRHTLVTGAGSGIGKAIALAFSASGHRISLCGRRTGPLEAVRDEIAGTGGEAQVHGDFDVTDPAVVGKGIAAAIERFGDIGVLVNCAGEAPSAAFDKTDLTIWNRVIGINLSGTFLVTQAALASVKRAGKGRIINIASTAGLTGYPYVSAYCASKHGVVGLTRALALELARTDVTVNSVCPGFTDTPLLSGAIETITSKTGRTPDEARASLARSNPQGRLVTPQEVVDTVLWLSSERASAITGQAIPVAGGEVLGG